MRVEEQPENTEESPSKIEENFTHIKQQYHNLLVFSQAEEELHSIRS